MRILYGSIRKAILTGRAFEDQSCPEGSVSRETTKKENAGSKKGKKDEKVGSVRLVRRKNEK